MNAQPTLAKSLPASGSHLSPPAPEICQYSASAPAGPGVRANWREPAPRAALPRGRAFQLVQ